MKKLVTGMFIAVVFLACDSKKSTEESQPAADATPSASETPRANPLTEAQANDGWKLLFNGENMDGWRTFQNQEADNWEVADGALHCKPKEQAGKRADILTVDQYGNFELVFDWKIAPGDNSGVIYRATEEFKRPYLSGPEYQVMDDEANSDRSTPSHTSGSDYDMYAAPVDKPMNPAGQWNTGRIVANGNHVEHWLNGTKVVEYELHSPEWNELKATSKWKNAKGYGAASQGHIDLQDHGGEVWYRNIRIKSL